MAVFEDVGLNDQGVADDPLDRVAPVIQLGRDVLDDDGPEVERAVAVLPGGSAGLAAADCRSRDLLAVLFRCP